MSLNFKTVNINSSTYPILTKEQISAVLVPVTIVLIEEEIIAPTDSGPVFESTGSTETSTGSGTPPVIIDNVPYITNDDVATRGPWGEITVGQLTAEIIRDFEEGAYAGGSEGVRGGKVSFEIIGPDGNPLGGGSDTDAPSGGSAPRGRA
jgi:hypothetical protein